MVALRSQGNWRWEGPLGPHLQLRQEPQGSSDFRLGSQGLCTLGTGESGLVLGLGMELRFPSRCPREERPLVELYSEPGGFSG